MAKAITTEYDDKKMQDSINRTIIRNAADAQETVKQAGTMYTNSFRKAMPQSKKLRKSISFEESLGKDPGNTRTTYVTYGRNRGTFYARSKRALREYRVIDYRGLGKASIVAAGKEAGLPVTPASKLGSEADDVAHKYGSGIFNKRDKKNPYILFTYTAKDVAGYPGRKAAGKAMSKAAKSLNAWARRMLKNSKREFEK